MGNVTLDMSHTPVVLGSQTLSVVGPELDGIKKDKFLLNTLDQPYGIPCRPYFASMLDINNNTLSNKYVVFCSGLI